MFAPLQVSVPALCTRRPSRKRVPVPLMLRKAPEGMLTLPPLLPNQVESPLQLIVPPLVSGSVPLPASAPALMAYLSTLTFPRMLSVPPVWTMPFVPVTLGGVSGVLVELSTESVPLPDSVTGEATVALRRRSVPLWISIAPAAVLERAVVIVVVPLVLCLRIVPLFAVVWAAVQPQWL